MSTPIAGPLSVTPLYSAGGDTIVWWDDAVTAWNSVGVVAAPAPIVTVTAATALPGGTYGDVLVRNGTSAGLTVTLPLAPVTGQAVRVKDAQGNAGTYPITIAGAAAATIDGNVSYVLRLDYASVGIVWLGDQWGTR